jgi:hypothetical protein
MMSAYDRHSGAGRNPGSGWAPCAMLWTPAFAGVTELPFFPLILKEPV